jgi:hypothetical protein
MMVGAKLLWSRILTCQARYGDMQCGLNMPMHAWHMWPALRRTHGNASARVHHLLSEARDLCLQLKHAVLQLLRSTGIPGPVRRSPRPRCRCRCQRQDVRGGILVIVADIFGAVAAIMSGIIARSCSIACPLGGLALGCLHRISRQLALLGDVWRLGPAQASGEASGHVMIRLHSIMHAINCMEGI